MTENWKQIPLEEALGYEVSNLGHMRSWWGKHRNILSSPRGLKLRLLPSKRLQTSLCWRKQHFVHRLVLLAFVGPPEAGQECRHLDGDPTNNKLGNLKWGTKSENMADRDLHGMTARGGRNGRAKLSMEAVLEIRRRYSQGSRQKDLAIAFGVHQCTISVIVRREGWL